MYLKSLPICLVLATVLSCATTPENSAALEVLHKIESSLLQGPELAVKIQYDHQHTSVTWVLDGKEYRETGVYVVKRGIVYWVWEDSTNDVVDFPVACSQTSGVPGTSVPSADEKPTGRTLLDILHPWGLVDPLIRELLEEHIMATSLQTGVLAAARLGHDADGPFLVCRFRLEEKCYPLAKEYWNRNFFCGAEMGPPQLLTGTAEHKLWYDPVTFTVMKRTIASAFALEGGRTHTLPAVSEVYKPRFSAEKK
jgi:hypothetical protein